MRRLGGGGGGAHRFFGGGAVGRRDRLGLHRGALPAQVLVGLIKLGLTAVGLFNLSVESGGAGIGGGDGLGYRGDLTFGRFGGAICLAQSRLGLLHGGVLPCALGGEGRGLFLKGAHGHFRLIGEARFAREVVIGLTVAGLGLAFGRRHPFILGLQIGQRQGQPL